MSDVLLQIVAVVLLAAVMWIAHRRWIRPYSRSITFQQRGALWLVLLALAGGFVGSPFWWMDAGRSFAWDLPPLASRMLAAAGWSFFVVCALALQRPTFRRLRLVMLLLFVYLAPLVVAILLLHLERFDFAQSITYGFFVIAAGMTVAATWYLLRPVRLKPDTARDLEPARTVVETWLAVIAILLAAWGLALFLNDTGPSDLIWVWPGDLLSSRLIGVMLLTIAAGAAYSLRYADTVRVMLATTLTYAFGVAMASLWNVVGGKPIKPAYLVVFGVIFLGCAALLLWDSSIRPRPTVGGDGSADSIP